MIVTKENINDIDFQQGATILIDKPYGVTSFYVVVNIRKVISRKINSKLKIGHAGTLDPLATGLLILCTGRDTKIINSFQAQEKVYSGQFYLGATRPSYDKETEVDQTFEIGSITDADIESVRKSFLGMQSIVPPSHSAIQVNGVRAYKLARRGIDPELKPKIMEIKSMDFNEVNLPIINFRVCCSKGTYIRALAHELGSRLHNGAYLENLRREHIGDHDVSNAWNFEEFVDRFR